MRPQSFRSQPRQLVKCTQRCWQKSTRQRLFRSLLPHRIHVKRKRFEIRRYHFNFSSSLYRCVHQQNYYHCHIVVFVSNNKNLRVLRHRSRHGLYTDSFYFAERIRGRIHGSRQISHCTGSLWIMSLLGVRISAGGGIVLLLLKHWLSRK